MDYVKSLWRCIAERRCYGIWFLDVFFVSVFGRKNCACILHYYML
jgi:hypothetical protein